jgi:hypothetical protein
MIYINGNDVKITGKPTEVFEELVILKVSIAQDESLMLIDQMAMEEAIEAIKTKSYTFPEVRKFKIRGEDKTDEFRKKGSDLS